MVIYGLTQAADFLGLHYWQLRNLCYKGLGPPAVRTKGGHRRWLLSDLSDYKRQMRKTGLVTEGDKND